VQCSSYDAVRVPIDLTTTRSPVLGGPLTRAFLVRLSSPTPFGNVGLSRASLNRHLAPARLRPWPSSGENVYNTLLGEPSLKLRQGLILRRYPGQLANGVT
jgi:hypothetical protein